MKPDDDHGRQGIRNDNVKPRAAGTAALGTFCCSVFLRQSGSQHFDTQSALPCVLCHSFFSAVMAEGGSACGLDRCFPVDLSADGAKHGAVFSQILLFQSCITKFACDHIDSKSPWYGNSFSTRLCLERLSGGSCVLNRNMQFLQPDQEIIVRLRSALPSLQPQFHCIHLDPSTVSFWFPVSCTQRS